MASFMTKRSHSSLGITRHGSTDDGSVFIHVNPNRVRQPRKASSTPSEYGEDPTPVTDSDENTRLLSTSRTDSDHNPSNISFSQSRSLESSKTNSLKKGLSISTTLKNLNFKQKPTITFFRHLKVVVLFFLTVLCCGVIMLNEDEESPKQLATVSAQTPLILASKRYDESAPYISLTISGPFTTKSGVNGSQAQISINNRSKMNLTIIEANPHGLLVTHHTFYCEKSDDPCNLTIMSDTPIAITWETRALSWQVKHEVVYAFLVLAFVYILIIFELVHRTLAAMLGALASLAVLSALNQRPSMEVIVGWLDMETLSLLFGMMILVAIFSETGFFDYSALLAYKTARGKVWPLITILCVLSAVISAFLDNVTTILLMAPVTIRLCEVLNLDPKQILMAEVLFSNIGGTATAIGDPPNVIIVGALSHKGITFSTFTLHMFPGILLVSIAGYGMLRLYYRNINEFKNKDPPDIAEMKHEIGLWRRYASRLVVVTREETLMRALFLQKAVEIEHFMYKTLHKKERMEQMGVRETIKKLERQYRIKDVPLLFKSGFVLGVVILFLFMYSFVDTIHLEIGWIAVLGAMWLLVIADNNDLESVLHKVEWGTLLFFASLFILMEALSELGMIKEIGDGVGNLIKSVDQDNRLVLAVIVILWVSAIASSFIDNIPYTTAMVPVLEHLSEQEDINVPLLPMVIALAFGACLGGNGTLIGASCNVVCAGIAEQHGYGFSFKEFFKVGFPMMLVTTFVACMYVLLCHVAFKWNYA